MLVSFRSCGPKDHAALLKLVIAYNRFEKNPFHRKRLSQGLDVLLRNPSQGKMWLMVNHKKPVGFFATRGSGRWRFTRLKIIAGNGGCGRSNCSFPCATKRRHSFTARQASVSCRDES